MSAFNVPDFPDRAVAVTPSDAVYFVPSTLYIATGGDVTVEPAVGGNTLTITGVLGGSILPFRVIRVLAATTAACIRVS